MIKFRRYSELSSIDRAEITKIYNNKVGEDGKLSKKEVSLIVKELFKEISCSILDSVGGVLLKGIGYFCVWKSPKRFVKKGLLRNNKTKLAPNYHTNGHIYHPTLITDVYPSNFLSDWSMDRAFNDKVKKGLKLKLESGFKYKLYYTTLKSIFNKTNKDEV